MVGGPGWSRWPCLEPAQDKALSDLSGLQDASIEAKASFDRYVADATAQKAAFDVLLERTQTEAAEHKAAARLAREDAATQKAVSDRALEYERAAVDRLKATAVGGASP